MTSAELFDVLKKAFGYEVVLFSEAPNLLRIVGRVPSDPLMLNQNNWKLIRARLFAAERQYQWALDISKWYFFREGTDLEAYAWRILLQGEDIAQHYATIADVVRSAPKAAPDVMEIPLGVPADRNNTGGGRRGAGPTGSVAVGPMAVQRKMMGG